MLSTYEKNYGRRYHYPMILFHTDLTDTDKIKIRSMAPSLNLEFRSMHFEIPHWLDKSRIPERTPCSSHSSTIGYRHMSR